MSQINLTSPVTFTTAMLIADVVTQTGGSVDAVPQLTQVGTQAASIALEIQSTLGAFLLPRVTTTQMNTMTANMTGVNGMLVYNTTDNAFYGYISGAWTALAHIGGDVILTQGANMVLTPSPILGIGTIALSTTLTGLTSTVVGNITTSGSNIVSSGGLNLETNAGTIALFLDTSQNATFKGNILLGQSGSSGNSLNIQFNNGTTTTYISNNSGDFIIDANNTGIILQTANNVTALTIDTSQNAAFTGNITLNNSNTLVLGSNNGAGTTFSPELVIYESSSQYMYAAMNLSSDNAAHIATVGAPLTIATAVGNSLALNSGNTITFGTSGSTLALTLNASQNAVFAGTVNSGNITLSTSNINSSGSLVFGTNGSTTALTIDTSQNATLVGTLAAGNGKFVAYGASNQNCGTGNTTYQVNFETQLTNTMTNFTVTTNNKFTYTGSGTVYWLITYSVFITNVTSGNYYSVYVQPSSTSANFGGNATTTSSVNNFNLAGSCILALTNGQYFNIDFYPQAACHLSPNSTETSTLMIYQLP